MRTVRKLLTAILVLMYIISTLGNAMAEGEAISVDSLQVQYEKNIKVSLNNEIDTNALGYEDVKILHDITIISAELDPADSRKVLINLDQGISENSIYNIITIDGADGNMDFETGLNLDGEEIFNEAGEGIESISIIDPKNIELRFFDGITDTEVTLKLFRDIPVDSLESISNTEVGVKTIGTLAPSNNYIFMLIAAKNVDNSNADIENGIYNFETPSYLEEAPIKEEDVDLNAASEEVVEEPVQAVAEEVVEETVVEEPVQAIAEEVVEETVVEEPVQAADLNSATEENTTKASVADSSEVVEEASNIEAVAAEATAVPETGAASGILIFITMLLAFGVHMKNRK